MGQDIGCHLSRGLEKKWLEDTGHMLKDNYGPKENTVRSPI